MARPDIGTFNEMLEKTYAWLDLVCEDLGGDRRRASTALRGVLHALRDRLPVGEAADLGAQLPVVVRGMYYDGWRPAAALQQERLSKPIRTREAFLDAVRENWRTGPQLLPDLDPDRACRAVFRCIDRFVTEVEVRQVVASLPEEVRALWPELEPA